MDVLPSRTFSLSFPGINVSLTKNSSSGSHWLSSTISKPIYKWIKDYEGTFFYLTWIPLWISHWVRRSILHSKACNLLPQRLSHQWSQRCKKQFLMNGPSNPIRHQNKKWWFSAIKNKYGIIHDLPNFDSVVKASMSHDIELVDSNTFQDGGRSWKNMFDEYITAESHC